MLAGEFIEVEQADVPADADKRIQDLTRTQDTVLDGIDANGKPVIDTVSFDADTGALTLRGVNLGRVTAVSIDAKPLSA